MSIYHLMIGYVVFRTLDLRRYHPRRKAVKAVLNQLTNVNATQGYDFNLVVLNDYSSESLCS